MLSNLQKEFISEHACSLEHCFDFFSLLFGEPFLLNNTLYYFDHNLLTVVGYPLSGKEVSLNMLENHDFNALYYFGPKKLNFYLERIVEHAPKEFNREQAIFLKAFSLERLSSNLRNQLRKPELRDYIVQPKTMPSNYDEAYHLIDNFLVSYELDERESSEMNLVKSFLSKDSIQIFELRKDSELIGMSVFSTLFEDKPINVFNYVKRGFQHAGDFLMNETISFFKKNNALGIYLGYSINEGVYNFKKKWLASDINSLPFECLYKKPDYSGKFTTFSGVLPVAIKGA